MIQSIEDTNRVVREDLRGGDTCAENWIMRIMRRNQLWKLWEDENSRKEAQNMGRNRKMVRAAREPWGGGGVGGVGVAPEEVGELAMRVLQWETTAHLTRTAQITKTNNTKSCKAVEQLARSSFPGGDSQPLWNTVWQLLSKLNIHSPYNSAILLPRETKPRVHRKSYMIVFIANFS